MEVSLNTTPTTKDHRAVAAVIKKSKIEGDDTPTAKDVRPKQSDDQR